MEKHLKKILVMGIGNLLLGDEGVGVHGARTLLETELPEGTEVIDAGTAFLDALSDIENAEHIIILDAVQAEGESGTVYRIPLDQCRRAGDIRSMHEFDIFRTLEIARDRNPKKVIVLGVEPAYIGWSTELSQEVSQALPRLIDAVKREIGAVNKSHI
ncbi:hydrogenase maturation protease [Desulfococcaceae bacterium HSG8]|nr:hydrogenase maturation protease [Desulfococcaceae bacterium HSG8]